MIPQEDNVFGAQDSVISLENQQFIVAEFSKVREEQWKRRRLLAHEEFTKYLEHLKNTTEDTVTKEETKRLMIMAYQGTALRYQRTPDTRSESEGINNKNL